ncbi:MAG: undecaprenyl-phosphate glucose phosphotransferase [Myxococcota bacterium]
MLYRYSEVFRTGLFVIDALLVAGSWLAAYAVRFYTGLPAPLGIPDRDLYLLPLVLITPLWAFLFRSHGLYEPRRTGSLLAESAAVVRATIVGVLIIVAANFFTRDYYYSRGVIALFTVMSILSVCSFRLLGRLTLRAMRRHGYNQRFVLVVGDGELAEGVIDRLNNHPEVGLQVLGVLSDVGSREGRHVAGVPVIGHYSQIKQVLARHQIDQVVLAPPRGGEDHLEKLLASLADETVTVRLVPDFPRVMTLRSSVEEFDGLPLINIRESPLLGWSAVIKRGVDIAVSATGLLLGAPLLGAIAVAIRASSGRPVLFVQPRMGLDGRVFTMFKFRTMSASDEKDDPSWTRRDDPRRTRLGAVLRKGSLDELPQLWNVLRGEMSLVGPRPERPVLIEQFRREIPGYMLRHKVKAGMTGWAQLHGWRGDTSLHERIEHDIYYIQNWSLWLDFQIMFMTLFKGWFDRNAY